MGGRRDAVQRSALAGCRRIGLYHDVTDAASGRFLDRSCAELVEASMDECPVSPPYNDILMAFRQRYGRCLEEEGYGLVRVYLQRLCTEGWTWRQWCRYHATRMSRVVAVALAAAGQPGPAGAQDIFYGEPVRGIGVSTELAGGRAFEETLVADLFFYASTADSSNLVTDVIRPGNKSKRERVFAVAPGEGTSNAAVERCRVVERANVCRPLDPPAEIRIGGCGDDRDCWGERLEIALPTVDIDWQAEFLRLTLPAGAFVLKGCACTEADGPLVAKRDSAGSLVEKPSPELVAPLPAPSELERQYLEQRPFLRLDASPLTRNERDGADGFNTMSLSFDGGVYRRQARGRWLGQLKWSGDVATRSGLNFNNLTAEAGAAYNLLAGDWLPVTISARGEADQGLDAIDLSAEARLAYVLPFNPSLQRGAYRPAAAPLINVIAAYGAALARPDGSPDGYFFRAGYEARWRVPVAANLLFNLRHAGLWNRPEGAGGAFHALWDLAVEVDLGDVTYLIGYRNGEAAPLFLPVETTRAGLSFRVGGS